MSRETFNLEDLRSVPRIDSTNIYDHVEDLEDTANLLFDGMSNFIIESGHDDEIQKYAQEVLTKSVQLFNDLRELALR